MFNSQKKRKSTRIDTLLGQHSKLIGDIHFSGGLHIDGNVKGNIRAENDGKSMISLSESGSVEGEVRVSSIVLNGVVVGDVHGEEHIQLSSKAKITGNVYYNVIEIAAGAEVNGKLVRYTEAEAEAEKVTSFLGQADTPEINE